MKEVEDKLRNLVGYGLGMETALIPKSLRTGPEGIPTGESNTMPAKNGTEQEEGKEVQEIPAAEQLEDGQSDEETEEDRFTVMSLDEARRIQRLIGIGIGIELGIEIIIEDCEIYRLAKRIVFVKSLLKPFLSK
jgi:hypothetical protein